MLEIARRENRAASPAAASASRKIQPTPARAKPSRRPWPPRRRASASRAARKICGASTPKRAPDRLPRLGVGRRKRGDARDRRLQRLADAEIGRVAKHARETIFPPARRRGRCASSASLCAAKNGEPANIERFIAQRSWRKPGSVSSRVLTAPPGSRMRLDDGDRQPFSASAPPPPGRCARRRSPRRHRPCRRSLRMQYPSIAGRRRWRASRHAARRLPSNARACTRMPMGARHNIAVSSAA